MKSTLLIIVILCFMLYAGAQSDTRQDDETFLNGTIWFTDKSDAIQTVGFDTMLSKKHFTLEDDLYARVFLKNPLKKLYSELKYKYDFEEEANKYNYAIRIKVDDEMKLQWLDEMSQDDFEFATTRTFIFSTEVMPLKHKYSSMVNDWVDLVFELDEGKHKVVMEFLPLSKNVLGQAVPVLASGQFALEVDKEKLKTFKKRKSAGIPQATLKSPELEKEILMAGKAVYESAVPLQAVITDVKGDWSYARDEFDNITGRQIIVSVVYAFPQEEVCFVKTALFYQGHQGNGVYENAVFVKEVPGYFDYEIDCEKIKP